MRKLLLLMVLAACSSVGMKAKSVVFVLADGTEVYYLIDKTPVMKWADGVVTVETDTYTVEGISRFYISETDEPNAIEDVVAKAGLHMDGSNIVVKTAGKVDVYTVDGKSVDARQTMSGGYVSVDTSTLPQGIYIVRIGNQSMKFLKR